MFRNQVLDQPDALQPGAGPQRLADLGGIDTGDLGNRCIGFGRIVDLEFDQQRTQVALVARQRAVQQQRALGLVELQQTGQRIDVFLDQGRLLTQRMREPVARDRQDREQVLRLVLGVFIEVEEKRTFFVRASPDAMTRQESAGVDRVEIAPGFIAGATPDQEFAQALQHGSRPHQMAPGQRQQAIEIATHIEPRPLFGGQCQHEMRTHQLQHRCLLEPRRRQGLRTVPPHRGCNSCNIHSRPLDHWRNLQ